MCACVCVCVWEGVDEVGGKRMRKHARLARTPSPPHSRIHAPTPTPPHPPPTQTFAELDITGDGVINPEEWMTMVKRNPGARATACVGAVGA